MFTGIVSDIGTIGSVDRRADLRLTIDCGYDLTGVAIGASIACSGVCLTVVGKTADAFAVDISGETVARTASGMWTAGRRLNLERALRVGDELGGHIVTGHVDGVGGVADIRADGDSWVVRISVPATIAAFVAAKGSITLDGVSLTVNAVHDRADGGADFTVNLIPHTRAVTTLGDLATGQSVNLEIDTLARYLARMRDHRDATQA